MYRECWSHLRKNLPNAVKYLLAAGLFFSLQSGLGKSIRDSSLFLAFNEEQRPGHQDATDNAARRLRAWNKLIHSQQNSSIKDKLKVTNDFFNQFYFEKDSDYEGTTDYWKTPEEFIADGGGDCEDFSIAKYFTLLALKVPLKSLRITYVTSRTYNRAHMVLTYYATPQAEPLILDNLVGAILPASRRPDLIPVYSFNGEGLWLAKQRGREKPLGRSTRLDKWRDLILRMRNKGDTP
ncbi:periplasmic protein [Legionella spiritensis]|nr:periplasmic protein [Legionella spiritensis]